MSVIEFRHRLYHAILDLLWRQWSALGIPGQIADAQTQYVLDPEWLLYFSAGFCRYDARLYDLVVEWLCRNGALVSIQRLNAIAKTETWGDRLSLGFMAGQAMRDGKRRWRRLAEELRNHHAGQPKALFILPDGRQNDFIRTPDQTALQYGLLRNAYCAPEKTQRFSVDSNAAFLLQLRGAFGLSARAETILVLLTEGHGKIQRIAARSAFSWKTIQDALGELCAASLVDCHDAERRSRTFFLRNPQGVLKLFGKRQVAFPDWGVFFRLLAATWEATAKPEEWEKPETAIVECLREAFATTIGEPLLHSRLEPMQFFTAKDLTRLPECLDAL